MASCVLSQVSRLQYSLTDLLWPGLLGPLQQRVQEAVDFLLSGCQRRNNSCGRSAADALFGFIQVACGVPQSHDQMRVRKSPLKAFAKVTRVRRGRGRHGRNANDI